MTELQDASGTRGHAEQVFYPSTVEEVCDVVRLALRSHKSLAIAGANTGLAGGSVPTGDWCVSLARLRSVTISGSTARCQSGVTLEELARAAGRNKLFLGPNPTEITATVGGAVSTNAGGARSFRYGAMRKQLLGLEAVMADGTIRRFARGEKTDLDYIPVPQPQTTKNSAGYFLPPQVDWVDLVAGSEGTLAIVTSVDLQLQPDPPAVMSAVIFLATDEDAVKAVADWRSLAEIRMLEYVDERALEFIRSKGADVPNHANAAIFLEQNCPDAHSELLDSWISRLEDARADGERSWFGITPADRERFRSLRHFLPVAVLEHSQVRAVPKLGTDYAVPLSQFERTHEIYREECNRVLPGKFTIFGHAGDANNHINFLPETIEEAESAEEVIDSLAHYVAGIGGTIAAEHGIGKRKRHLLPLMYTSEQLNVMLKIKKQLDPDMIFSPGNIFLPEPF